jgi:signal recognition particle GTPase
LKDEKFIKETLRVLAGENSLGLKVTKPNQELIIMRGIPGSGKSTKAKSLVVRVLFTPQTMLLRHRGLQ